MVPACIFPDSVKRAPDIRFSISPDVLPEFLPFWGYITTSRHLSHQSLQSVPRLQRSKLFSQLSFSLYSGDIINFPSEEYFLKFQTISWGVANLSTSLPVCSRKEITFFRKISSSLIQADSSVGARVNISTGGSIPHCTTP